MPSCVQKLCFICFFLVSVSGCMVPNVITDSEQLGEILISSNKVQSFEFESDVTKLHLVGRAAHQDTLILFIHGTPGSWTAFAPQLDSDSIFSQASLFSIDRPGWGLSFSKEHNSTFSIESQARQIGSILGDLKTQFSAQRIVLVGHSLGASIVPRIAMDYPEHIDGVVAIAGSLGDVYPSDHWYNVLASFFVSKLVLPEALNKANVEVKATKAGLTKMNALWADMSAPMLVIQGGKDKLVDPRHADFAEQLHTGGGIEVRRLAKAGHILQLTHSDYINQSIISFLAQLDLRQGPEST